MVTWVHSDAPLPNLPESPKFNEAFRFAVRFHDGQLYGGRSYGFHLRQVIRTTAGFGFETTEHQIVAALHDVVEDTSATVAQIREQFGPEVAKAVAMLTRHEHQAIDHYMELMNPLAFAVKLADRLCNLQALGNLDKANQWERDRSRRLPKYQAEMPALRRKAWALGGEFVKALQAVESEVAAAGRRLRG